MCSTGCTVNRMSYLIIIYEAVIHIGKIEVPSLTHDLKKISNSWIERQNDKTLESNIKTYVMNLDRKLQKTNNYKSFGNNLWS